MGKKNPYLVALRAKYTKIDKEISDIRASAVDGENVRELSTEDLETVRAKSAELDKLFKDIEAATAEQERADKFAEGVARVNVEGSKDDAGTRNGEEVVGGAETRDRDPGFYRAEKDGGTHSFFGDLYRSQVNRDHTATERLEQHTRANTVSSSGTGIVTPKWLLDEYTALQRQGRYAANIVRQISLGRDPRVMTLPKQVGGTDGVIATTTEGNAVPGTDALTTGTDTVTPVTKAGKQTVTRQLLDSSTPGVDMLIMSDLIGAYNKQIEALVCTTMTSAASTTTATFATDATAWQAAGAAIDALVDGQVKVRQNRKAPADVVLMDIRRYGQYLKLKDTTGRPLIQRMPNGMNVYGVGTVPVDGEVEGLAVIATDGMGDGTVYPQSYLVARASDTILFEGDLLDFRYEFGPNFDPGLVILGVWNYVATTTRYGGVGVTKVTVTAA
jgi:HK97 family phage major capsid protein